VMVKGFGGGEFFVRPKSFRAFETSLEVTIEIAVDGGCYEADRGTLQDEA